MRYTVASIAIFTPLVACASGTDAGSGGSTSSTTATGGTGSGAGGSGGDGGVGGTGPDGCMDGAQNGDETDVDCGGSCDPCAAGGACGSPADCGSGFCADGLCCDSACDGVCESCTASATGGEDGTCAAVTQGTDPDGECTAEAPSACGASGMGCDGASACLLYPMGTACQPPSCTMGVETGEAQCDGDGTCVQGALTPCGDYICDTQAGTCKTSCASNLDCVPPATCNTTSGVCSSTTTFNTQNFMGLTEYPLDTDTCMCCGGTTTAQTADAFCVLAGMTSAVSWTTGNITGNNCYCWDCTQPGQWASNCCSGTTSRPMILTVTCQ